MDNRQYSLRELRARHRWTQAEIAKKLGVSTTTYFAWEQEPGKVKISNMMKICELFGLTLNDIFLG